VTSRLGTETAKVYLQCMVVLALMSIETADGEHNFKTCLKVFHLNLSLCIGDATHS